MSKSKAVNWTAIKKRYLQGEKPKDIAADYGLTSQQVRSKAHTEKWGVAKETIFNNVQQKVQSEYEQIASRLLVEYQRLAFSDMRRIAKWNPSGVDFKDSEALSPDDSACVESVSEHTNQHGGSLKIKLFNKLGAMDSLAEIVGLLKQKEEGGEEQETPGFIVSPDV
jgi:hypothetical protein